MSRWQALTIGVVLLAAPTPASAITVSSNGATTWVESAASESAKLTVNGSPIANGTQVRVGSQGPLEAGMGCGVPNAGTVACDVAGAPLVVANLGDGDDEVLIEHGAPMRVEVAGGQGNDRMSARSGLPRRAVVTTFLDGGPGDDHLIGGLGPDAFRGGDGNDKVDYRANAGPTTITMNGVADDGLQGEGDDVGGDVEELLGSEIEPNMIVGNHAPQRLEGGANRDVIDGGAGNDSIVGWAGDDDLAGGPGDDDIIGVGGDDRLDGGTQADSVNGSEGNDTILARDATADRSVGCSDGVDRAIVDKPFDLPALGVGNGCEWIDAAWTAQPTVVLRSLRLSARRGRLRVPVLCQAPAGARCAGRIVVTTWRNSIRVGRARLSLGPDGRRTLTMRLPREARRALRRGRTTQCLVQIALTGSRSVATRARMRRR